MSTQAARHIRFSHTEPQQGFRLLELTPELVELVSSKNAPVLELKSPYALSDNPGSSRQYVNLCTPSKTYRIRQVQSSNSIHVIKPTESRSDEEKMQIDHDQFETGMTAIAKCGSTLELHVPPEGFSAVPFLQQQGQLRVYDRLSSEADFDLGEGDDADMDTTSGMGIDGGGVNARVEKLKNALFADIPVSRAQCDAAWVEVCAFVHHDKDSAHQSTTTTTTTSACWRPSALVKLDVWKRILEGAVLQSIDLQKQFLVKDLWNAMLDDLYDDGTKAPFPRALFEAVLMRVCDLEFNEKQSEFKWASIDKDRCTQWVGETYLEATAPMASAAIGRGDLLNAWKDHLPEGWRDEVAVSKLTPGTYKRPDPTLIYYAGHPEQQGRKTDSSAASSEAAAARNTRNWHELFKKQKRN